MSKCLAAKIATKSWSCDADPLLLSLSLPSLKSRRPYFKLLCAYTCKFLFNYQFCPVNVFHFHPNPNLRVYHDRQLIIPYARFVSYFNSYRIAGNIVGIKFGGWALNRHYTCKDIGGFKFGGSVRDHYTYTCKYEILADFNLAVAS